MKKQHKLKRYKSIYSNNYGARSILKVLGGAACVVLLVAVGWFAYDPIYSFIMSDHSKPTITENSSAKPTETSSTVVNTSSVAVVSEVASSHPESTPDSSSAPVVQPNTQQEFTAFYMPDNILYNPTLRKNFIEMCKEKGADGVMFDVKNEKGKINFKTDNEKAAEVKAVAENAIDLQEFTAQLKAAGLKSIGRVFAFKDPIAAQNREASVKFGDTEWSWLDNSADLGGKPWLNPMSDFAREYVVSISTEAVRLGVDEIMLDGVQFPVGYALEKASFGTAVNSSIKSSELAEFSAAVILAVEQAGGSTTVYMSAPNLIEGSDDKYGSSPELIAKGGLTVGVMPSLFGNVFNSENLVIESPCVQPYETVSSAIKAISHVGENNTHMAMLQCYSATNINALNNKKYTAQDVAAQQKAAADSGIQRCIFYSPNGDYSIL